MNIFIAGTAHFCAVSGRSSVVKRQLPFDINKDKTTTDCLAIVQFRWEKRKTTTLTEDVIFGAPSLSGLQFPLLNTIYQPYPMRSIMGDLRCADPSDILDLLPLLYFSKVDLEDDLLNVSLPYDVAYMLRENLHFLTQLRQLNLLDLWSSVKSEESSCSGVNVSTMEYEAQNVAGKAKLFFRLLYHLLYTHASQPCFSQPCVDLLQLEPFEFELIAFMCSTVYGIPDFPILPAFVCGYISHANHTNFHLLKRLFRNIPFEWFTVWNWLIRLSEQLSLGVTVPEILHSCGTSSSADEPGFLFSLSTELDRNLLLHRIEGTIRSLLLVCPNYTRMVIERCLSIHCFPGLVVDALFFLDKSDDNSLLIYLKRMLLDSGTRTRSWISGYLKRQMGADGHLEMFSQYFIKSSASLIPNDPSIPLTNDVILKALLLLRVLAAMRGFVNYIFPPTLSSQLLTLLTHKTVDSERGSQYITYSLAFLIGLRSSLQVPQDVIVRTGSSSDIENQIVVWLQGLINRQTHVPPAGLSNEQHSIILNTPNNRPYAETLLLLAILFHTNQPGPITDLISNLLGLRIPSLGRTVNGWRKIFLQSVFTESMIASQVARVPITPLLNRSLSTHLPIQCALQLLKSHAFAKNKLEIKDWLVGQIRQSVRPMHPLLPDLVEAHIVHSFGTSSTPGCISEPSALISERELIAQIQNGAKYPLAQLCSPSLDMTCKDSTPPTDSTQVDFTAELLFLYYALYVYDYQIASRLLSNRHCLPGEAPCVYSDQLWDCIPITYLLRHARSNVTDYGPLYPRLLQLVTNHFPNLTVGELMIQDELLLDPIWCPQVKRFSAPAQQSVPDELTIDSTQLHCATNTINICSPTELDEAFEAVLTHIIPLCESGEDQRPSQAILTRTSVHHLIRLIQRLSQAVEQLSVDCLLPFGPVLGHQCPRLLLAANKHPLFTTNRRFVCRLEYLWCRLHLVMPRKLELLTVNALLDGVNSKKPSCSSLRCIRSVKKLTGADIRIDPVESLMNTVDRGVFRCPPVLRMFLRILESNLLASRSYWGHRLLERVVNLPASTGAPFGSVTNTVTLPSVQSGNNSESALDSSLPNLPTTTSFVNAAASARTIAPVSDEECEVLCSNMLLTQNATVVQLLLEHCLPRKEESTLRSQISVLREVQNIVCTYVHSMFIAEPALAEVIVWQTFPHSLLPISTQAIPSLHICLDSVLHVYRLSGDYAKMVFCLDLVSHLSLHYNIQSAFERAAFMIDSLFHLLSSVVCADDRPDLLQACLPAFLRLGGAFPSLAPVIVRLLLTVGTLISSVLPDEARDRLRLRTSDEKRPEPATWTAATYDLPLLDRSMLCLEHVMWTFDKLIHRCSAQRYLYYPPELTC
ncbi:hypothetical protein CRM22_009864 [Opisthorchis felineus]|uniref:Integrator complex subunit 2 n=1 Tax=Opisthorchis felineus TaxID=147828 RepID=A0A4S2L4X5_OPIFE|nr:hypothetical protein CRM22_009864 [Opisthorchis felineus]